MMRIETVGRPATAQTGRHRAPDAGKPVRALVVVPAGGSAKFEPESAGRGASHAGGRSLAGFIAQLIVSADPTLRPSRIERTRRAAALYAEAALFQA